MSLGSRGDMEPFLALGEALSKQGHTTGFCFPAQFESLAKEVSPHFYRQDVRFLELLNRPEVRNILGQVGSVGTRLMAGLSLSKEIKPIQEQLIFDQEAAVKEFQPDEIIFHIKCIYPIFWALSTGGKTKLLSPMPCTLDPVNHEPHIGFGNPGTVFWNLFTYKLGYWALVHKSIMGYGRRFIKERQLKMSSQRVVRFLQKEINVEYPISEELFKRPHYWPKRAQITAFRERNKQQHYQEDPALLRFLQKNPSPIFVSFGSMINADPEQVGSDLLVVAETRKMPMIVNTSWGGIKIPNHNGDWIFEVSDIPYDYIFPKVKAVIHHGGSGTTHSALRCVIPQAIIPHLGDQFFWNRCIAKEGKGVKGFPIKEWNRSKIEHLMAQLHAFQWEN
jgi:sterol 3beta-glucosyltransferase